MISDNYIDIKECDDIREWSSDLLSFNFSIFQTEEWILSISESQNLTPVFLDLFIENEKRGKISGVISTSKLWGKQIYFYSGPALHTNNIELYHSFTNAIKSHFIKKGLTRTVFGSYGSTFAPRIKSTGFYSFKRKEFIVDLTMDILKNYSRNIKRNIAKAELLTPIPETDKTNISTIKNLLEKTKTYRLGKKRNKYDPLPLPHMTYKSLKYLINSDSTILYTASVRNRIAGFLMVLVKHPFAEALLTGIEPAYYNHGISPFLYIHAFNQLKNNGFISVNLGGIPDGHDGEKLAQFKKSLGAEEITVYGATTNYITYPYKLLNPALRIGRMLPKDNAIVKFLKKFV